MTIQLRPTTAADVPDLGRILFEAFHEIATRHGFPPDFPSVEYARLVCGLLMQQEAIYGIAAHEGALAKGSNHVALWDEVAGIGPISVDVASQGEGIGRRLMQHALDHARDAGFDRVRLLQDAFNMQSLALYASLGFAVKEPVAYLALSHDGAVHRDVRAATAADLDAMAALCRAIYGIDRKNEIAAVMAAGFPAFVLDRGRVVGYLIGTAMGHGVAESDEDMLALLTSAGASMPDAHANVPMRNGALYRAALAAGHRNRKVMNLMALGDYEDPRGTWAPSVLF